MARPPDAQSVSRPGETKTVTVKVKVPLGSDPGKLSALAVADAVCPAVQQPTTKTGEPLGDIPVTGQDSVDGPTVGVCVVPDITGRSLADAEKLLTAAGCILGDVTEKPPTNPTDTGKVLDQTQPPGTEVPIGTPVNVDVGGPLCTIPSLAGKTVDEAKTLLDNAGCKLGDVTVDPNGKPEDAGKIITTNPPAGDKVPRGTQVDVTIAPPSCNVPNLVGLTETEARAALEKAGCRVGDVTPGPDNPEQAGKISEQGTPSGTLVPAGTDVDITVAGPVCTVPNLAGMTETEARAAVEAQGCTLRTSEKATTNPSDVGKVLSQNPTANLHVPKGSAVDVSLGVQVLGETIVRSQQQDAGTAAPTLVRTGGVALGGLALWLLFSGLAVQLAGSNRLWKLVRRVKG